MNHYKLYIFDWDGTIMDTTYSTVLAVQNSCKELGFNIVTEEKVKSIIGKTFESAIISIIPELIGNSFLYKTFSQAYYRHLNKYNNQYKLFDFSEDILNYLNKNNKLLAVATGRDRYSFEELLNIYKLRDYFVTTYTASDCISKPHPEMIDRIVNELCISKEEVVMIGDTEYDIMMANAARVDSVGICHGVASKEDFVPHSPKHIINDFKELYNLLIKDNA